MKTHTIRLDIDVDCRLDALWQFYENTDNLGAWVPGFRSFALTSAPPHGEGTTYVMDLSEGEAINRYQGRNLIWKPRQHVREQLWGGRMKRGEIMTVDYRFAEAGQRCRLSYENAFQCGFATGLLFKTAGRAYCQSMISQLKASAEAAALA